MDAAAASVIGKWRERQPELRLAEVFLRGSRGELELGWACVLAEWHEAMFAQHEQAVVQTKLDWWGRDLARGATAQHPLGRLIARAAADRGIDGRRWIEAADAARVLASHDEVDTDAAAGCARWSHFSTLIAALECDLFDHAVGAATVSAQWRTDALQQQLKDGVSALLPMNLRARFGGPERWRAALPEGWQVLRSGWAQPDRIQGGLIRHYRHRLQARFWRRACSGMAVGEASEVRALGLLWHGWQAARSARRS